MSRFYDALIQAGGLSGQTDRESAAEELDLLAGGGLGRTALSHGATPELPPEMDALLQPRERKTNPWLGAAVEAPEGLVPERGFGREEKITLDQSAGLLPNTSDTVVVEHYRRLRTKLMQQHAAKPFRTLVVASPGPQEGKTVTILNIALSFAMLPAFRVLVIDGDVRQRTLSNWLGVGSRIGFSNLLEGTATLQDAVIKCDSLPIHAIAAGTSKTAPAELLHSPQLMTTIRNLSGSFDLLLLDSPPVNLVTDVQMLASKCDAVLLVARAFFTKRKALEKAVQDLQPFRIIGTVLNGSARTLPYRTYGYYGVDK